MPDEDASRIAYLEAALEAQSRYTDEAMMAQAHSEKLLGESDAARNVLEQALERIAGHKASWSYAAAKEAQDALDEARLAR